MPCRDQVLRSTSILNCRPCSLAVSICKMKTFCRLPVVLFLSLIGLVARASSPSSCDIARGKLDDFLSRSSAGCKVDSDCGTFYYRETCRGPVVLPKVKATTAFEKKLQEFKDEIQIGVVCADEWKSSPACSPIPAFPKCQSGKCLDSRGHH